MLTTPFAPFTDADGFLPGEQRLANALLARFKRKEWVANRADPTQVTQYRNKHLTMTASWGVEAKLTILGRTWETYDNRFFVWLFGFLENAYAWRENERDRCWYCSEDDIDPQHEPYCSSQCGINAEND